jgi:hypothetical protein
MRQSNGKFFSCHRGGKAVRSGVKPHLEVSPWTSDFTFFRHLGLQLPELGSVACPTQEKYSQALPLLPQVW